MKYFTILFLLFSASASAQFCETVTDSAWSARFERMLAESNPMMTTLADTGMVDVPVIFHVELRDGSPVIGAQRIADALKATNDYFFKGGVRFVRCGEIQTFPAGGVPRWSYRAVNVSMYRASTGCGVAMGNTVQINVSCNRTLEHILSHELGHVVGLPHTHGYTNSGTTDELADGSNCDTHGDRFCDTPADPNLLGVVNGACGYTGTAKDANGMAYAPDTRNIMSYTSSHCADTLTPMQLGRSRAVALASTLECCFVEAPLVRDTTVCHGETAVLTAIGIGREIRWYENQTGGSPVGIGAAFTTPPVTESQAWYAEVVDSCVSSRARVLVHVALAAGVMTDVAREIARPDSSARQSLWKETSDDRWIVFRTGDGTLWMSDGRETGTRRVAERPAGDEVSITDAILWKDMLLYGVNDRGTGVMVFRYNPANGSTDELLRITGRDGFSNFFFTPLDSAVLLILNDGNDRTELWRTDGTPSGTQLVLGFPHTTAFNDFGFIPVDGVAYFQASDSLHGSELWRSDGSTSGTWMVADIAAGAGDSDPGGFAESDGRVYLSADDGSAGQELWVTDGTTVGTRLAADIHPGSGSSRPGEITAINGFIFMYADDGVNGVEPYVSDGTPEGTRLVADIRAGNGSFPQDFIGLNGRVFCVANDGSGSELWELRDNGFSGAALVKDIHPFSSSGITGLASTGKEVYFTANDAVHGNELWRSDGSSEGTRLTADIDTSGSSSPNGLTLLGGKLYFFAGSQQSGPALYVLAPLDAAVCSGESAELLVANTDGVVRWYRLQSGGSVLHEGRSWTTPPITADTVFWAELASGNCVSPRSAIPVRVLAPVPTITGPTSVLAGSDVVLQGHSKSGAVEWHARADGTAPIDTGKSLLLLSLKTDTTIYARSVERGCSSVFVPYAIAVYTETGIEPLAADYRLRLHPVPASERLFIDLGTPFAGELRIVDVLGRTMHQELAVFGGRHAVSVADFRPGTYVLELKNSSRRVVQTFIVAR